MKHMSWLGLFGIIVAGMAGIAQAAPDGTVAPLRVAAAAATGVVQQIRPEQGKIKISHEPIAALGWPAMTMTFRVKDKSVLEGIAAGDKVNFELGKDADGLVITRIEKVSR